MERMDVGEGATDAVDWAHWERLLRERGIVIDRPRGSAHPRYPDMIYPLDYGYIPGTVGGDGAEVDLFIGTARTACAPRCSRPMRSRATASSSYSGT